MTKLIVAPNNNTFADGEYCAIQLAESNPTKENVVYNFQHFFNKKLLNEEEFNKDVYKIPIDKSLEDANYNELGYFMALQKINHHRN